MVDTFSRQTYLDQIALEIRAVAAKDDITDAFAAGRIIAEKFGYDLDEVEFVDGAGDRGIDFWYASDTGLYLYQVKTHNLTERGALNLSPPFDNGGVLDLMRARNFILSNDRIDEDHKLASLKDTFLRVVRNHRSQETDTPVHIYLTLVILGSSLTEAAFTELARLC